MTASQAAEHQRRVKGARPDSRTQQRGKPAPGRSKYGAVRTEVDGISFASKLEAKRYGELKLLASAGQIFRLELQPRFPLIVEGEKIALYVADFGYHDANGLKVIEDSKGFRTREYGIKKRLFEALHKPLKITEVRS